MLQIDDRKLTIQVIDVTKPLGKELTIDNSICFCYVDLSYF